MPLSARPSTLHIVGAGWAGLSAAVAAHKHRLHVQLHEAAHQLGGRARSLPNPVSGWTLDNGQHLLIDAYQHTLALIQTLGGDPSTLFLRQKLDLRWANGHGFQMRSGPATWGLLHGILLSQGWTMQDKFSLLSAAVQWRLHGFQCEATLTVADLCTQHRLTARVVEQLIEPLCLSALNTAIHEASALVFLRVLHDAFYSGPHSSDLLIPRVPLHETLPHLAAQWLKRNHIDIVLGHVVSASTIAQWLEQGDRVLLACASGPAARLTKQLAPEWATQAQGLQPRAIATVYLQHQSQHTLPRAMLALPPQSPAGAQFVFDHAICSHRPGLLAAVCSAHSGDAASLGPRVLQQLEGLGFEALNIVKIITEKQATFACTPLADRPPASIQPHLWACGDYIQGPYPSTLEGAVRSAQKVIEAIAIAANSSCATIAPC